MSGVFETAAGAFAVVGVADVVVRTGREVYSFLCDIADAPDSMQRLSQCVQETTTLALACRRSLDKLKTRASSLATSWTTIPFDSALKAVNRELQSLKLVIAKYNGTNKTWSRVKYVLDERKIEKALISLERSKMVLANALIVAYGESSFAEHQSIETLTQQCSQQVGLKADSLTQLLTTALDAHHTTLALKSDKNLRQILANQEVNQQGLFTKLDAQNQQVLASGNANQQILASQLDAHHQHNLANTGLHQRKLFSIRNTQGRVLSRQNETLRTSKQIYKQTINLSQKLDRARGASTNDHQKTRDLMHNLKSQMNRIEVSVTHRSATVKQSGREIYFFGERRDMLMVYLHTVREQLKPTIDQILSKHSTEVSARQACWLESEFQKVVGSAAQEEAARYLDSTATSFDQWTFSEDKIDFQRRFKTREATGVLGDSVVTNSGTTANMKEQRRRHRRRPRRTLSLGTPAGTLRISFPRDRNDSQELQNLDDISISFSTESSQQSFIIDAHFFSKVVDATRSKLCAQLNVFTVVQEAQIRVCRVLLKSGTVEDVDTALRNGTISPYHLDDYGNNLCLLYATSFHRIDLLDYYDRQGIGIVALRHDHSIWEGLPMFFDRDDDGPRFQRLYSVCNHIAEKSVDPVELFSILVWYALVANRTTSRFLQYLKHLFNKLLGECDENPLFEKDDCDTDSDCQDWKSLPAQLRFLLNINPGALSPGGGLIILRQWMDRVKPSSEAQIPLEVVEEVMVILIEAGVNIREKDRSPSMYARKWDLWEVWCRALGRSGKHIEEVLQAEGNEWLLKDDWQDAWKEKNHKDSYSRLRLKK